MKTPKISIVIPNLNGEKFLIDCLNSLKKQSFLNFEVIIIDNGSTDNSIQTIKTIYPESIIYKFSENTGFAKAVNKGILLSKGEYVFLLNNDTELDENCLLEINDFFTNQPKEKIMACKMLLYHQRDKINSAGDLFSIYGIADYLGRDGHVNDVNFNTEKKVFSACAGAAVYKKSLFDKIGYFDEDFFAYLEDIDFCFRANLLNEHCTYNPKAIVYHIGGGTSKKIKDFSFFLMQRNSLLVILKNFPIKILIISTIPLLIGQARAIMSGIKHGKLKLIIKSYIYILINFKKILKKRKVIQDGKTINNYVLWGILSKKYPFDLKNIFQ